MNWEVVVWHPDTRREKAVKEKIPERAQIVFEEQRKRGL